MDLESKKEGVIDPQNTPSSKKKNERPSSKEKKGKRKKRFQVPPELLASIWWIATFAFFIIGIIGLVKVILQIYMRGSPDWNYALIITPNYEKIEMAVYTFKGLKRDLNIRHSVNVSLNENLEKYGITDKIKNSFRTAVSNIPWLSRSSSPVIVAAAGNMRMIRNTSKTNYDRYMDELNQLIQKSPLKYFPQSLRTLNDWEEALYGWVALNYLSDFMIKGRQPIKAKRDIFTTTITSGGLDLDETSLHVSYEIPRLLDTVSLEDGVKENTRIITLYGRVYFIYTKTIPCFGSKRIMNMYLTYNMEEKELDTSQYYYAFKNYHCSVEQLYYPGHYVRTEGTVNIYLFGHPIGVKKYRLNGTCSKPQYVTETFPNYKFHSLYFYGPGNADKCLKDVVEIIDKCKDHFGDICPDFNFPARPYDVTFTVFNEFAIYAQLAGLKSGDPKTTWDEKRKKICRDDCLKNVIRDFPSNNIPVTDFHYTSLCLMITYLYYFLDKKLKLTTSEWSKLRIMQDIDETKISWYLGYVANVTNALPTYTPFYGEVSLEDLLIEGLVFASILTISSATVAFALRNSNVLAVRPLMLPR